MNSKSTAALNLYHQWFGDRARSAYGKTAVINKPGATHCAGCGATGRLHSANSNQDSHSFCDVCVTVAGSYEGIKNPGRMGAGWAAIITPENAILSTGNEENMDAFKKLPNTQVFNNTVQKTLIQCILSPPEPPLILVAFGNSSPKVCRQLRASYSKDLLYISGDSIDRIDAGIVRRCVSALNDADVPQKLLASATSSVLTIARGVASEQATERAKKTIIDVEEKHPGITEIVRSMPLADSLEHRWIMACAYAK